jgi:hypothetical protein
MVYWNMLDKEESFLSRNGRSQRLQKWRELFKIGCHSILNSTPASKPFSVTKALGKG